MSELGALRQNIGALMRRAATDADFRALCLSDSAAAYAELTGQSLPEQYAVRFIEPKGEIPSDEQARPVYLPHLMRKSWLA